MPQDVLGKFQGPDGDRRITGRGPETDIKLGCPSSPEQVLKREKNSEQSMYSSLFTYNREKLD